MKICLIVLTNTVKKITNKAWLRSTKKKKIKPKLIRTDRLTKIN